MRLRGGAVEKASPFHNLYRLLYIVRVFKSRKLRCLKHVARVKKGWSALKISTGNPIGRPRGRWEDKWILKK